ncbi:MAG: hypothetical protein ACK53Y_23225, partial [bacterium]
MKGSNWILDPISQKVRSAKNNEFILRGNHKSAKTYEEEFLNSISQEIQRGWMLPLPLAYISKLKHGELSTGT